MRDISDDAPLIEGFEVLSRLGGGGFASVWRCREHASGRVVAIKVPLRETATPPFLERFDEECTLLLRLRGHPNVIAVIARTTATLPDGLRVPALVMEHVANGRALLDHAEHRQLDRAGKLRLFEAACAGVAHLHRAGVAHLDLKPGNILVDDLGAPRVMDLGAAKVMLANDVRSAFFTPQYASPEQLRGTPEALDQSSDVYSLGKILAALMAGPDCIAIPRDLPQEERLRTACAWSADRFAAALPRPDPAIEAIVRRCTAPSPADRYHDASEVRDAVAEAGAPWVGSVVGDLLRTGRRIPTPLRAVVVAAALALAAALLTPELIGRLVLGGAGVRIKAAIPALDEISHVRIVVVTDDARVVNAEAAPVDLAGLGAAFGVEGVDASRPRSIRALHALLVDRCAEAGAAAIVFDIAFPPVPPEDPSASATAALAESVRGAAVDHGCPVIVGVQGAHARHEGQLAAALAEAGAATGFMNVLFSREYGWVVPLVTQPALQRPRASLAAAAVAALRSADPGVRNGWVPSSQASFELDEAALLLAILPPDRPGLRVALLGVGRAPLTGRGHRQESIPGVEDGDRMALRAVAMAPRARLESATLTIDELLGLDLSELGSAVRGRLVLVSANYVGERLEALLAGTLDAAGREKLLADADLMFLEDGRVAPKAWIHASLIEGILSGQPATIETQQFQLWIFGAALLGALLGRPLGVAPRTRGWAEAGAGVPVGGAADPQRGSVGRALARSGIVLVLSAGVGVLLVAIVAWLDVPLPHFWLSLFVAASLGALLAIEYRLLRPLWRSERRGAGDSA
ncbi:MAG TPA: protein kinase [Phycisphaerales bacterium]|nr:protein kinase [Phycisphaerales bacterium]